MAKFCPGGDVGKIWQDHKSNHENLQQYSDAMVSIAEIWQDSHPQNENRVEWCMAILREYFWADGLKKQVEKDLRKIYYDSLKGDNSSMANLEVFLKDNASSNKIQK